MKVPKEIKQSIRKSAKYNAVAIEENEKVRNWLLNNDLYNDAIMDQLIDCIELNNNPKGFIEFLENNAELWIGNE